MFGCVIVFPKTQTMAQCPYRCFDDFKPPVLPLPSRQPTVGVYFLEAGDCFIFFFEGFENSNQFGDGEEVFNFVGQVDDFDDAAFLFNGSVGPNDFTQTGGIEVGNVGKVKENFGLFVFDGAIYVFP